MIVSVFCFLHQNIAHVIGACSEVKILMSLHTWPVFLLKQPIIRITTKCYVTIAQKISAQSLSDDPFLQTDETKFTHRIASFRFHVLAPGWAWHMQYPKCKQSKWRRTWPLWPTYKGHKVMATDTTSALSRVNTFTQTTSKDLSLSHWIYFLHSSPPSAAYSQWIGWALVQIMACRLFGAKPLS